MVTGCNVSLPMSNHQTLLLLRVLFNVKTVFHISFHDFAGTSSRRCTPSWGRSDGRTRTSQITHGRRLSQTSCEPQRSAARKCRGLVAQVLLHLTTAVYCRLGLFAQMQNFANTSGMVAVAARGSVAAISAGERGKGEEQESVWSSRV